MNYSERKKTSRKVWTNEDTRLFLACYKNRLHEFNSRKKRMAYAKVLDDMIDLGFEDKNVEVTQLEGKWRTLCSIYRTAKAGGSINKFPFEKEIEEILSICNANMKEAKEALNTQNLSPSHDESNASTSTVKCRLCFTFCLEFKLLFDKTGWANKVYATTIRYFDPMQLSLKPKYPDQPVAMCLRCWRRILKFDKFKHSVLIQQAKHQETEANMKETKTMEEYFGKQQGCDPLNASESNAQEKTADNHVDTDHYDIKEEPENEYTDDDAYDDEFSEDANDLNNENEFLTAHVYNENEKQNNHIENQNTNDKNIDIVEQSLLVEPHQPAKNTDTVNAELNKNDYATNCIVVKHCQAVCNEDLNNKGAIINNTSLASNYNNDENNFAYNDDDDDMDYNDYDSEDMSDNENCHIAIPNLPLSNYLCIICGISCASVAELKYHGCRVGSL